MSVIAGAVLTVVGVVAFDKDTILGAKECADNAAAGIPCAPEQVSAVGTKSAMKSLVLTGPFMVATGCLVLGRARRESEELEIEMKERLRPTGKYEMS